MKTSNKLPQSENYAANIKRYGEHSDSCICCGKRIQSPKQYVHMSTDWVMKHVEDADESDSQGLFPVGPECSKKIANEYLHSAQ